VKTRLVFVGGRTRNIPPEVSRLFDVVYHLDQEMKQIPVRAKKADAVVILAKWVSHGMIRWAKENYKTVISVDGGLSSVREALINSGLWPEKAKPAPVVPESPMTEEPPPDPWTVWGATIIEAVRNIMVPSDRLAKSTIIEAVSTMGGVPTDAIEELWPELFVRGVLSEDRDKITLYRADRKLAVNAKPRNGATTHKIEVLRELPFGPYKTLKDIFAEMKKRPEFAALCEERLRQIVHAAVKAGIVEKRAENGLYYIDSKEAWNGVHRKTTG
jgi:hypothetical protein